MAAATAYFAGMCPQLLCLKSVVLLAGSGGLCLTDRCWVPSVFTKQDPVFLEDEL